MCPGQPLPAPAAVGPPVGAVTLLERHARSRGGVGPPGRGVVGGGGAGVGRTRGRGRRGGRTSARPADFRASDASLRVRTVPAPGARWESGRGGAAPARAASPSLRVSAAARSRGRGVCLPEPPVRWPVKSDFLPQVRQPSACSPRTDPQQGQPWQRPGPVPGRGRGGHVPNGELCPVRSPETSGGAGPAAQVGERGRPWDSTSGGRGSRMAQGSEKWKDGARTWRYWAGTGRSAHAGVGPRGCGESWWTSAALQDSRSAGSWKHLRSRQAPL